MVLLLAPGQAHPHPPLSAAALARFLHVDQLTVGRWRDRGMPMDADGNIEPFAAVNWVSWGQLDECPTLARRWRTYRGWFEPFVLGRDHARRLRWRRSHHLYLPTAVRSLTWFLPLVAELPGQALEGAQALASDALSAEPSDGWIRLQGAPTSATPEAVGEATVRLAPYARLAIGSAEHAELCELVTTVAGDFHYAYRHHRPDDYVTALSGAAAVAPRWSGSCLDCAMALAAVLAERGRRWRLRSGMVAHSAIANPHFWIECESASAAAETGGWVPLDPSLPAIMRMLGADWRAFAKAYTGGQDARRIAFGVAGRGLPGIPGGASVASVIGEAVVVTGAGESVSAWPCIDWVCGDCEGGFAELD